MTACTTSTPLAAAKPPPPDLAAPCPDLQPLQGLTGADVALQMIEDAKHYRACQRKQRGLVEAWPG